MDSIARCCWQINKCAQNFWKVQCEEHGFGIGQVPLLSLLYRKENLSQEEISRYLCVDKAATAKNVACLLELGLIARSEDPTDARIKRITLTVAGRALEPLLARIDGEWQGVLTTGLTGEETIALESLIAKARANAVASDSAVPGTGKREPKEKKHG
jgi:DNA-binding MarR family transcriptional regulator